MLVNRKCIGPFALSVSESMRFVVNQVVGSSSGSIRRQDEGAAGSSTSNNSISSGPPSERVSEGGKRGVGEGGRSAESAE